MQSHCFRDFDQFAMSVVGIDCNMLLQNPEKHIWSVDKADLDGLSVQWGRLGSGNIVEGQSTSNGHMLYMPLTDGVEYRANGHVIGKDSFAILEPGCEFCVSTKVAHDWCTVVVPNHMLALGGDPGKPPWGGQKTACRVAAAGRPVANKFRVVVRRMMSAIANRPEIESSPASTRAASELLTVFASVVGRQREDKPVPTGRRSVPRQEIILRSLELLEQRAGDRVLVTDLAAVAGVSERTLRSAFKEYFGVGPVQYLQIRQLHQVHRELRTAAPEAESVSDVLIRHGQWEFGRFAARYRRLFGELPSDTLRSKVR